jgi:hypothetical protein
MARENNGGRTYLKRRHFRVTVRNLRGSANIQLRGKITDLGISNSFVRDATGHIGFIREAFIPLRARAVDSDHLPTLEELKTRGDFVHVFYIRKIDPVLRDIILSHCIEVRTAKGKWRHKAFA